ncbi:MAG: hypothetical protein JXC32_20915 [Anaerolineae bacterium]|nr:hypothetical protein [Anaerolineae bacterium]
MQDSTPQLEQRLRTVSDIQKRMADLHPCLALRYPVAVATGRTLHIYEAEEPTGSYRFSKTDDLPMAVPPGVRAAFPLDALAGRPACVITADAFDTAEGRVEIFHEFVHCYQWEGCEPQLRETLTLAKQAAASGGPMWEIAYPFPHDMGVARTYRQWMTVVEGRGIGLSRSPRIGFREQISELDWEYATWQEWKEGFARWVENRIRNRLGLPQNRNGRDGDFSRVTFYAGGAALIAQLVEQSPTLAENLEALFEAIRACGEP